jgi:uncharacterized RDD family membrane protein YckC
LRGLVRAFIFILTFLVIKIMFAFLPLTLARGLHDRFCGTYQVKKREMDRYFSQCEERLEQYGQ